MGYQEREQTEFQGLFDTRKGAASPRWSAEDVKNVDFTYRSVRGRAPMVRAIEEILPHKAISYEDDSCTQSDWSSDALALDTATDAGLATVTGVVVRAYVTHLDLERLAEWATGSRWCIASSTGDSTDFGAASGQTGGWAMFLEHNTQDNFRFTFHWRSVDGATGAVFADQSIVQEGVDEDWNSIDDVFCIEWNMNSDHTNQILRYYMNGSNSTSRQTTSAILDLEVSPSGTHFLAVGAVALANQDDWRYPFIGTIGQVIIFEVDTGDDFTVHRWEMIPQRFDLVSAYDDVLLVMQPEGLGYEVAALGKSAYTSSGAGAFLLNPPPVTVVGGELLVSPNSGATVNATTVRVDETEAWGVICGVNVKAPPPGDDAFVTAGNIIASGTAEAPQEDWAITVAAPSVSGFRMFAYCRIIAPGGGITRVSRVSADLAFDTDYRFAFFVETDFAAGTTLLEPWVDTAGVWTSSGTSNLTGRPMALDQVVVGTLAPEAETVRFDLTDVRIHGNIQGGRPANSAAIIALDTYPPDGQLTWPASLVLSFDPAVASSLTTETMDDGRERLLQVRDNKTGVHTLRTSPWRGESRWSGIPHMIGGERSATYGIHAGARTIGDRTQQTLDVVKDGGVWRYDVDAGAGHWPVGSRMLGRPTAGVGGIDTKDRTVLFGEGMGPLKVFPMGIARVGYGVPFITLDNAVSSAGAGGLVAATAYSYRLSTYNSLTGQESNLSAMPLATAGTTGGGHDTLDIDLSFFLTINGEDYDTINIYREAQTGDLWYLEQQLPKPKLVPPEGPTVTFTSGLAESDLVLQPLEVIDNHPPEEFTTATIAGRTLVVGGAGLHPGWVYYSKPLLHESFPPTNLWQLNDDDSDKVVALVALFGRLLILKERSIWAVRDDATETGEQPVVVHQGRGCIGSRASTLADNRAFFVSPDRAVYATDGVEIQDVSSQSIRQTMDALTVAQLQGIQLSHNARKKQIWMSIPNAVALTQRDTIYTFSYELGRWSKYEFAHDSISTGHEGTGIRGEHSLIGGPSWIYKQGTGREAYDSDSAASDFEHDYARATEFITTGGNLLTYGMKSTTQDWHVDIVGMPALIVFYTEATYSGAFAGDPVDHPLFHSDSDVLLTTIRKVTHVSPYELWFDHFTTSGIAHDRALVMVGSQRRRYLSQWYSPQGEGFDYVFSGMTFVNDQDVLQADLDAVFRMFVDQSSTAVAAHDATEHASTGQHPDYGFSYRKRGRRSQYEILSGTDRSKELDIQRAILRYRTRGPRRTR